MIPTPPAVMERAKALAAALPPDLTTRTIGIDGEGSAVLHWFGQPRSHRQLSIFVGDGPHEFLKSWGANIYSEMDDGEVRDDAHLEELIRWCIEDWHTPSHCECAEPYVGARPVRSPNCCERYGQPIVPRAVNIGLHSEAL